MRIVRVSFLVFEFSCTCSQKNSRAKYKLENLHLEPHDYQLAPVVQKVDSSIHRIILYPLDSAIGFPNIYPMDSTIHRINLYPVDSAIGFPNIYPIGQISIQCGIVQLVSLICIHWIVIHPVNSAIHLLNYWSLINNVISIAFVYIILAPVVQTVDRAIHRIKIYPVDNAIIFVLLMAWIANYPVDCAIQRLNN